MDLARIRQWCDEDNWHIEGFRSIYILTEDGRVLAESADPSIGSRLREGRQYVKELLAALDAFDALIKAAREYREAQEASWNYPGSFRNPEYAALARRVQESQEALDAVLARTLVFDEDTKC